MDPREPIIIESTAHRPRTPGWARLVGAAIAFGLLALIGLKWFLIVIAPLLAIAIVGYRVNTGHWPD